MIFCYKIYVEATLSWIAVSEKLSPSTKHQHLYQIQVLFDLFFRMYPRRTSFSDLKGYFGKIIKLLGNNLFLCIAHLELSLGNMFDIE